MSFCVHEISCEDKERPLSKIASEGLNSHLLFLIEAAIGTMVVGAHVAGNTAEKDELTENIEASGRALRRSHDGSCPEAHLLAILLDAKSGHLGLQSRNAIRSRGRMLCTARDRYQTTPHEEPWSDLP